MARTVADAARLLTVLAGSDVRDAATKSAVARAGDYVKSLDPGALKGARIGVARKRFFGYSPAADRLIDAAIADMKSRGAVIVEPADIPTAATIDDCELEILLYEFKAGLNDYLKALPPTVKVRSLADVIAFNERQRIASFPSSDRRSFFGGEEGAADLTRLPAGARYVPVTRPRPGHRCRHDAAEARCDRRAHRQPGMADGLAERRSLPWRQLDACSGRRLSKHHRSRRICARAARRSDLYRPRVERVEIDRPRLRLRAVNETPARTNVSADGSALFARRQLWFELQAVEELIEAGVPCRDSRGRANELEEVRSRAAS